MHRYIDRIHCRQLIIINRIADHIITTTGKCIRSDSTAKEGIIAKTAIISVRTGTLYKDIIITQAVNDIRARRAVDNIRLIGHIIDFEITEFIGCTARNSRGIFKINRDGCRQIIKTQLVLTIFALTIQRVTTETAVNRIITIATFKQVGFGITLNQVIFLCTAYIFDFRNCIRVAERINDKFRIQIDIHAGAVFTERHRIRTKTTINCVRTGIALQHIIIIFTVKNIIPFGTA